MTLAVTVAAAPLYRKAEVTESLAVGSLSGTAGYAACLPDRVGAAYPAGPLRMADHDISNL